jgi:RNA polymerase sigma factor (TIGR02999 family)
VELVYADLEQLAQGKMRRQFGPNLDALTLEPAALVHETYLRLLQQRKGFENRQHFFAVANRILFRVLMDYHRSRAAQKRGGGQVRVTLTGLSAADQPVTDIPTMIDVLDRLQALRPRHAEIVKLRVFWGMEMKEIAETLGVSVSTVEKDWRFARAWLRTQLEG